MISSCLRRSSRLWSCALGLAMTASLPFPPSAEAIVVYGSEEGNTVAPTGEYAGSGWQYQGDFGSYLGTAISPTQFITAAHFGTAPTFVYDSISYSVGSYTDVAGTDMRVYTVSGGAFSSWAEIYTGTLQADMEFVTMGKGAERGDQYMAGSTPLGGWRAGDSGFVRRWGTNNIGDIINDGTYGELIVATFDAPSPGDLDKDNEAYFTPGDSGGGVFVKDPFDGVWKLAGVNLGDTGEFATLPDGSDATRGAVYDMGGLYYETGSGWVEVPDTDEDLPASIFISSVTGNAAAIRGIAPVPEPGGAVLILLAGITLIVKRRRFGRMSA